MKQADSNSTDRVPLKRWRQDNEDFASKGFRQSTAMKPLAQRGTTVLGNKSSSLRVLPDIRADDNKVWCNHFPVFLDKHPLSWRLFKAFLLTPGKPWCFFDLIEFVYDLQDFQSRSPGFRASHNQKFVKLVSRTRKMANRAVNHPKQPWIDWFCYDPGTRQWELFRLRTSYLRELEAGQDPHVLLGQRMALSPPSSVWEEDRLSHNPDYTRGV